MLLVRGLLAFGNSNEALGKYPILFNYARFWEPLISHNECSRTSGMIFLLCCEALFYYNNAWFSEDFLFSRLQGLRLFLFPMLLGLREDPCSRA